MSSRAKLLVARIDAANKGLAPHPFPLAGGMRAFKTYLVREDDLEALLAAIRSKA
jgi:hypothetical protein